MRDSSFHRRDLLKLTATGLIASSALAQTATAEDPTANSGISYDWETGNKEGWSKVEVDNGNPYRYGFPSHIFEFNIVENNPIEGDYSPQIECLNDGVFVQSPDLADEVGQEIQAVSTTFRLEGDLDASDWNNNRFRINDQHQNRNGYIRFDHKSMTIQWWCAENET